ncbi:MAG TPA: cbb3-type cytochrome c oxidase N-terminal domain-containing protein [Phycisphaerales bacterium]|jgi:cytochrome c oxidase cbb3-type subunit 3|nr:cbb3-type cytochrome c oxidase N-terminal domain-containing protein [Phycisphaerales bacterium]
MSAQPNQLTDHEYDGIREYDNPTPGWWHAIFLGSVVFSIGYLAFWHGSVAGWTIQDSWNDDQQAEFARIFGKVGELKPDEATILQEMSNKEFMQIAKSTFEGTCAACHKKDGSGDVGVNLCDDYYKNVTKVEDIYRVISEGANGGAMPSWKNRFSNNERVILASYVANLRGTNPAGGKAPEGVKIAPWPSAPAAPAEEKKK